MKMIWRTILIYFSFLWRTVVASFLLLGIIVTISYLFMSVFYIPKAVVSGIGFYEYIMGNYLFMFTLFVVSLVFFMYVFRWILNCLPLIAYRGFRVHLMRYEHEVKRYDLADTWCFVWSVSWRYFVIAFVALLFISGISFIFGIGDLVTVIMQGSMVQTIVLFMFDISSLYWTLIGKRSGRWLHIK